MYYNTRNNQSEKAIFWNKHNRDKDLLVASSKALHFKHSTATSLFSHVTLSIFAIILSIAMLFTLASIMLFFAF